MHSFTPWKATLAGLAATFGLYVSAKAGFRAVWGESLSFLAFPYGTGGFLIGALLGGIAHELTHAGAALVLTAKSTGISVQFGVRISTLMPYVRVIGPLRAATYRYIMLTPGVALGLLPLVFAFATGNAPLALYACFMTAIASGDLLVIFAIRDIGSNELVHDQADRVGCERL